MSNNNNNVLFTCSIYFLVVIGVTITTSAEKDDTGILSCDDEKCKHKILEQIANEAQDKLINESLFMFPKVK